MNNQKKISIYISLLFIVILIIGISFAYFVVTVKQENPNTLNIIDCFKTTITENSDEIILDNTFPISDEEGINQPNVYLFSIENHCDYNVNTKIYIKPLRTDIPNEFIKYNFKSEKNNTTLKLSNTEFDNVNNNYLIENQLIEKGTHSYELRLWIDEDTTLNDLGISYMDSSTGKLLTKLWKGRVIIETEAVAS